jgi:hypothetical protein
MRSHSSPPYCSGDEQSNHQQRFVGPYEIATTYLALGEQREALQEFEKAYEAHSICMIWLKVDPRLGSLRSDETTKAFNLRQTQERTVNSEFETAYRKTDNCKLKARL